jgi:hypothetical protein
MSTAEILIASAVKTVGKRAFLKAVEKMYKTESRVKGKSSVPAELQCLARKKGDRTGIKAGKHVLYDAVRCPRKELDDSHLCAVHTNMVKRTGSLPYGLYTEPLTEENKKVFGEI